MSVNGNFALVASNYEWIVGYSSLICGLPVIRPELEFSFGECLGDLASTQLDEQGEATFARCPHAEQRCPNPNLPECIPKLASAGRVKVQPVIDSKAGPSFGEQQPTDQRPSSFDTTISET